MAQLVRSMTEIERALKNRMSQALKMTRDDVYKAIQESLTKYYHEPVFGGSSMPKMYERLYHFLNSVIKTNVEIVGNNISCAVEVDRDYLSQPYTVGGATGQEIWEWANAKTHGGTVKGNLEVWNDAIDSLGGEKGILNIMKQNLIKCGIPIIN